MSVSYNRRKKVNKMKKRCANMTIEEYKKLRPDEVKGHKRIVDFMKEHGIACKLS